MTKIVAVMPVKGRELLLPWTIKRLKRIVDEVVCVTETKEERPICQAAGAIVTTLRSATLGAKWNGGFLNARQFDPDYYLYVGSSDWISDNWIEELLPIAENHELTGVQDFYEMHLMYDHYFDKKQNYNVHKVNESFMGRKVGYWKGYYGERRGEPIGIGRLLRRDFVKRIDYKPFDPMLTKSLDWSMYNKTEDVVSIRCDKIKCMALSTTLWGNKHIFETDMSNPGSRILPKKEEKEFLTKWFPEAYKMF
jgi:hypothetical protein